MTTATIRPAKTEDLTAVWDILKPIFRAGETYGVDPDISRARALEYWAGGDHSCFVAELDHKILATYFLCPNGAGGARFVCNCGFATSAGAQGLGLARLMLKESQQIARAKGYYAMQFNFVVTTNARAIDIWTRDGFETVGRLPAAFEHPTAGFVDALIMFKNLGDLS